MILTAVKEDMHIHALLAHPLAFNGSGNRLLVVYSVTFLHFKTIKGAGGALP